MGAQLLAARFVLGIGPGRFYSGFGMAMLFGPLVRSASGSVASQPVSMLSDLFFLASAIHLPSYSLNDVKCFVAAKTSVDLFDSTL